MATATHLPPMAPGGQWIRLSGDDLPVYVPTQEHIQRLLGEGGQIVGDPRPGLPPREQVPAQPSMEEALLEQIAQLRAELEQARASKPEPVQDAPAKRNK